MAEYTILLRTLLQTDFNPALDDYPIFDESYRNALNAKILNHYNDHEIGLETPDLFNHYLSTRMAEIMPYYNEMYRVQALIANPFHNFEYSEISKRETDGTTEEDNTANTTDQTTGTTEENNTANTTDQTTGESTENTEQDASTTFTKGQVRSHSAQSDTPQSNLTPYNVATGGYASLVNMSETESDSDQTTTDTTTATTATNTLSNTGTAVNKRTGANTLSNTGKAVNKRTGVNKTVDDYIRTITGSQGISKPEILKQYKSAFINIDREIINELRDLFMIVY